ncbi:MAG: hypothetical protein WCN95_16195 [bacterium]
MKTARGPLLWTCFGVLEVRCMASVLSASAGISMPEIFGDSMVLQW